MYIVQGWIKLIVLYVLYCGRYKILESFIFVTSVICDNIDLSFNTTLPITSHLTIV